MRTCRVALLGFLAAVLVLSATPAVAVTIETVPVRDAGNANDSTGYGAVDYLYQMGKYEVTNAQYCEFLTTKAVTDTYGLYNAFMSTSVMGGIDRSGDSGSYTYAVKSGYENMPVTYVSWYDAIRFVNWLQNGQGSGSTETGTYTITGGGIDSGTVAVPDAATRATWTSGPHWVLPSENEWYKAAYYQPAAQGGDTDGYWLYPTATNSEPHSDNPSSLNYPANSANFYSNDSVDNGYDDGFAVTGSTVDSPLENYLTNAGAYTLSDSFYGTFDQGGNVWEWNEAEIGSSRGLRGGNWYYDSSDLLSSSRTGDASPLLERPGMGFRVANVPEPGSIAMLLCVAAAGLIWWRRRK